MNQSRSANRIRCLLLGFAAVFTTSARSATLPPSELTTFVGASSIGSADGVGSAARFNYPWGCAVDHAGNTYVADTSNHTIRKVSPSGATLTLAGTPGVPGSNDGTGSAARFNKPTGIVVDSSGTIFVADSVNRTIRKISPDGVVTTLTASLAGSPHSAYEFNPISLALDAAGNLYTADFAESVVQKISPAGTVSTVAGRIGRRGIADGPARQALLSPTGGIAIDGSGNLYLVESNSIRKISSNGNVSLVAGAADSSAGSADGTGTMARFSYPLGITVDPAGNVFVADSMNNTIRRITPSGVVTTLAGNVAESGNDDGIGTNVTFNWPNSVSLDPTGNLVVTDGQNHTLRKINPSGQVTTLAGLPPEKSAGKNAARLFVTAGD